MMAAIEDGCYGGWLLWRMAAIEDGCYRWLMAAIEDAAIEDGCYRGWLLLRMAAR